MKIFVASFNRASDGALSKLIYKMKRNGLYTNYYPEADYILACGDRTETYDFILDRFRENKKIIHLWAGEISQGTHDEVYRHSITIMSCMQLCTNNKAKDRVISLCKSIDKKPNVYVIGNVMLDNMEIDENDIPDEPYDLILYNPPTQLNELQIGNELVSITKLISNNKYIWIESNGDSGSNIVNRLVNTKNLPREKFLGLLKNCKRFISNSSCIFYEAEFLLDMNKIIPIGIRNVDRESSMSNMTISGASNNIISIFRSLK